MPPLGHIDNADRGKTGDRKRLITMDVADLPQSVPRSRKPQLFTHQSAGLISFSVEHGTVNRLTPASQPAVDAVLH